MQFRRNILFLTGLLALSFPAHNQVKPSAQPTEDRIKVLNADKAYFNKEVSAAQILEGNVQIEHNGARMYCQRAFLFDKENRAEAFQNVHINQGDTLNLYGDSLKYWGDRKFAELRGKIRLVDRQMTLETDSLNYDLDSSIAWYNGGGKLTNRKDGTVLTSQTGVYFAQSRSMVFSDSVRLKGDGFRMRADTLEYLVEKEMTLFRGPTVLETDSAAITCSGGWYDTHRDKALFTGNPHFVSGAQDARADTIFYDRISGEGELFGNALVTDTTNRKELRGDYSFFRQEDRHALMTGSALFVQYFDNDTLYLHGDTLIADTDSTGHRLLRAFYGVRIFKRDFQGVSDSMSYAENDSLLQFFGDPILWQDANQLTAEHIVVRTYQGKIERMDLLKAAFIISEADTTGFNQIKGRDIHAFFRDNALKKITVQGNGQTIYYAGEEGKPKIGLNRADCSDILIYLDSSKIQTISFLTQPEARLIPISMLTDEDLELKDFKWEIMRRPESPNDVIYRD
jgi:lipopolysaccharide export system protein LptA